MRSKLSSHIKISEVVKGTWTALLITPTDEGHNRVEILGQRVQLSNLIDKAFLNASWDRQRSGS